MLPQMRSNCVRSRLAKLSGKYVPNALSTPRNLAWKETLDSLDRPGISMDSATYAFLLRVCGDSKTLSDGKRVHAYMSKTGLERDPFLGSLIVRMYCKCGAIREACAFFLRMREKNTQAWNFIIGAYAQLRQSEQALCFFRLMQEEGMIPDKVTFVYALSACAHLASLAEGTRIHGCLMRSIIESDVVVATTLVNMYGKCGSLENARRMFDRITEGNVIFWNAMLAAYVQHGCGNEASHFYSNMQQEGVIADEATFVSILSACATQTALVEGKRVHTCIFYNGLEPDVVVATALVNMYGKCNSNNDARKTFERMKNRDVIAWNAIIGAYAFHGHTVEALELFSQMQHEDLIPNKVTFVSILDVYTGQVALAEGKRMHARILQSGFEEDVVLGTALLSMYGRCNRLEDAVMVFETMRERNRVSWNAMIRVCAHHGRGKKALEIYDEMQQEGAIPDKFTFISILDACASETALKEGRHMHMLIINDTCDLDIVVANALLNLYDKCGCIEDAQKIFEKMPMRNIVSWNSLIAAYSEHAHIGEVFYIFDRMQWEGFVPDKVTFLSVLSACANQATLVKGKRTHTCIVNVGLQLDPVVVNALINMYGKCNSFEAARREFDKLPERNLFVWNAMIVMYAQHGYTWETILLFDQMQWEGIIPDSFSFASVLSACASQAVLAEGKYLHTRIMNSGFESDHVVVTALVNMYGKCGSLENAQLNFEKMPKQDIISWNTMISVCSQLGHCKDAIVLFDRMHLEGFIPGKVTFINVLSACSSQSALIDGKRVHAQVLHSGVELDVVLASAILNMYGKCGSLQDAQGVFDSMPERNVFTWNTLISIYAQHGHGNQTLHIFDLMLKEGLNPDMATFVGVLSACSHAGLIDEGHQCLFVLDQYVANKMAPKHYDCFIDLLGRAGQLDKAEHLISHMPFQPSAVSWTSLVGACRYQRDVHRGEKAANYTLELDPKELSPYVML